MARVFGGERWEVVRGDMLARCTVRYRGLFLEASPAAVRRFLGCVWRAVLVLYLYGLAPALMATVLHRGESLVHEYLELIAVPQRLTRAGLIEADEPADHMPHRALAVATLLDLLAWTLCPRSTSRPPQPTLVDQGGVTTIEERPYLSANGQ